MRLRISIISILRFHDKIFELHAGKAAGNHNTKTLKFIKSKMTIKITLEPRKSQIVSKKPRLFYFIGRNQLPGDLTSHWDDLMDSAL